MSATNPMRACLEAYRGQRVLVTGDTGFKGSWLALWLTKLGADVTGVSLPASKPSHFESARVADKIAHHDVDIRDLDALARAFESAKPTVVFHLAAQSLVRPSYRAPKETFDVNVGGTVNVLECVRASSTVRSAVMVTSDKCYENREWEFAYRENDAMGGHDPYSASKGAAEIVVAAYRRSFFDDDAKAAHAAAVASVRAGNVIGGGDWAEDRLIPDCVRALVAGLPIKLRNPHSIRPWQHVLEPLAGYLVVGAKLLADRARYADAYNFGPAADAQITVEQVARALVASWGGGVVEVTPDPNAPHEAKLLRLAIDKAVHELGWKPRLSADEAIAWTASWYRAAHEARGADMAPTSLAQIGRYEERMVSL